MSSLNSVMNALAVSLVLGVLGYSFLMPKEALPPPEDVNFQAEIERPGLVLVKFGAPWCPPCRQLEGELDRLVASGKPPVHVVRIDVDHQRSLAAHYRISSIPRMLLFRDGKQVDDKVGGMGVEQLQAWLSGFSRPAHVQ